MSEGVVGVVGGWGLFDQPLGHVCVGNLDLLVAGAGVGELLARVSVVQVLPDGRHLFGDVEASVLLCHHLDRVKCWKLVSTLSGTENIPCHGFFFSFISLLESPGIQ